MPTYSCFRLLTDNYADATTLANWEESSENSSFPVENTFARRRRAKVWRSGGYWNVESGSNTIVFQEDGSTDLTATIAVAEYRTTALFHAAIKSALEAASVNSVTYTVSQNSTTLRTVITSDGAGGATFDLIWSDASSTAMAGILGFDTTDDSGSLTYTADSLTINTEEFIVFDLGLPTAIEAFALVGERNEPIELSPSSTVKIQGNPTDAWSSPAYTATMPYNGNAIAQLSDTGLDGTNQYRYWRLSVNDISNSNGYIEINSVFLGNQFNPTSGRVQFPLSSTLQDRSVSVTSEGGNIFSSSRPKSQTYSARWFNLSQTEVEEIENLWAVYGTSIPFFVSMDSGETWSSDFERRVILARFTQQPTYQFERPDLFTMTMQLTEDL